MREEPPCGRHEGGEKERARENRVAEERATDDQDDATSFARLHREDEAEYQEQR